MRLEHISYDRQQDYRAYQNRRGFPVPGLDGHSQEGTYCRRMLGVGNSHEQNHQSNGKRQNNVE